MYKLLCVDDNGNPCHVDLEELIATILKKVPTQFTTVNTDEWTGTPDLYFREAVEIPTNEGIYKKLNNTPALVGFAMFHNPTTVGKIIFVSKDMRGVAYVSPDGAEHLECKEYDGWFYSIIEDSVHLRGNSPVRQYSNYLFGCEEGAVKELINVAKVGPANYISEINETGDRLITFGKLGNSDGSIIFGTDGTITCKKLIETGGKD